LKARDFPNEIPGNLFEMKFPSRFLAFSGIAAFLPDVALPGRILKQIGTFGYTVSHLNAFRIK